MSHESHVTSFCFDYFFHYLLYNSEDVRLLIARYLASHPVYLTSLRHNDEFGPSDNLKKMVLDVVMQDDQGYYYDIEMQNSNITREDLVRFISYAAKLLEREVKKGKSYNVPSINVLIIYTGKPIRKLEHFMHHIEFMDSDYCIVLEEGPMHIRIIQTQRMEEISMETIMNSQFHQFISLFADEENHKKEPMNEMSKKIIKLYEDYLDSDALLEYYRIERDRRYINTKIETAKREGLKLGKEEGKEEGIIETKKAIARQLMTQKYEDKDLGWLETCTRQQIENILHLITRELSYEELKTLCFQELG